MTRRSFCASSARLRVWPTPIGECTSRTPSRILLNKDYLAGRAALIPDAAAEERILSADEVVPGDLGGFGYTKEEGTAVAALEDELQAMGYETSVRNLFSGSHGVLIMDDGTLHEAADPRREGIARGE